MAEMEHTSASACSEETNSLCDEERIRKLFQACDGNGDGYIDSQDLLTVCRELNLEDSHEELMKELGADEQGRISYKEFLRCRLTLRPEIDSLGSTSHQRRETATPDYLLTSSENSLGGTSGGKCCGGESWEFDSGARDLSPEPNTLQRLVEAAGCSLTATNTASLLQLANKLHLAALASLRGEILELTSRLHAVTAERDLLKDRVVQAEQTVAQQYEERLTELHSVIAELTRKLDRQRTLVITEEEDAPSETEQSVETCSQADNSFADQSPLPPLEEKELLTEEVTTEKKKSNFEGEVGELRAENCALREQLNVMDNELQESQILLTAIRDDRDKLRNKMKGVVRPSSEVPVLKVAERVRLRMIDKHVAGADLSLLGVSSTEMTEQLVASLQQQCDLEEGCSTLGRDRLTARLDHLTSQVTLLQLSLDQAKSQCERLCLLVGKYESNATALRLALNSADSSIEAYDQLVSLLQAQVTSVRSTEEERLRKVISELKASCSVVRNTVVELESLSEQYVSPPSSLPPAHSRKLDLETAVLMQEVMALREDKAELRAKVHLLEREKECLELKLATFQSIQHLQVATNESPEEDKNGREAQLRERLKEVACTLERVSHTAELRQRQALELTTELKTTNSTLVESLERCKRKSHARLKRLEAQMLTMVERHAAQVKTLKQRISSLEEARGRHSQCSASSETSL